MDLFDLDADGGKALAQQAQDNPLDLSQQSPSFWQGSLTAAGQGFMTGGAKVGNLTARLSDAINGPDQFLRDYRAGVPLKDALAAQTKREQEARATRQNIIDYWTPDAATTGTAGNILHGFAQLPVELAAGGPLTMAAASGASTQEELENKGVSPGAATAVGGIEAAVGLAGFKAGAFGTNLWQRLLSGTVINTGLNAGGTAAEQQVLARTGNEEQAKAYNPLDPTARTVDILSGLLAGGMHHWAAGQPVPSIDPQQRDAIFTAQNAANFNDATAPGVPMNEKAAVDHQNAMTSAVEQINDTGQVNVAGQVDPGEFVPRGSGFANGSAVDYQAFRRSLESGGNPNAQNPLSSALGADQFTASTWMNIVRQEKPAWAQGLSNEEILAQRTNPERSGDMAAALDRQNSGLLQGAGQPVTNDNLYAMHHFGGKGLDFAEASGSTPMADILTPAQMKANPYLKGMTKADAIANWHSRAGVPDVDGVTGGEAPAFDTAAALDQIQAPPSARSMADVGTVIDNRLNALQDLAGRALPPDQVKSLVSEANDLEDTLREQYSARANNVNQSPENRLTADEMQQAQTRFNDIRAQLEQHKQATAAGNQLDALNKRLAGADDNQLRSVAESIAPERQAPASPLADQAQPLAARAEPPPLPERVAAPDELANLRQRRKAGEQLSPDELHRLVDLQEADRVQAKVAGQPIRGVRNMAGLRDLEDAGNAQPVRVFADADNFKNVNDTLGHDAGDTVIRQMGELFASELGEGNVFHRGGDEFVMQGKTPAEVDAAMGRVRDRLANMDIEATLSDGTTVRQKGVGFSYGKGDTIKAAEADQYTDKERRKAAGLRSDRRAVDRAAEPADTGGVRQAAAGRREASGERAVGGQDGQLSPVRQAAQAYARDNPDLPVLAHFDADGKPVYATLQSLLDDIDAEAANAISDTRAYAAAALCFISLGGQ